MNLNPAIWKIKNVNAIFGCLPFFAAYLDDAVVIELDFIPSQDGPTVHENGPFAFGREEKVAIIA